MARSSNKLTTASALDTQATSISRLSGPRLPSARPPSPARSELPEPVPRYDHKRLSDEIVKFEEEFQDELRKLNDEVCELLITMHIWATVRADLESSQVASALKEQVTTMIQMENDQEEQRRKLILFMDQVKHALAGLAAPLRK